MKNINNVKCCLMYLIYQAIFCLGMFFMAANSVNRVIGFSILFPLFIFFNIKSLDYNYYNISDEKIKLKINIAVVLMHAVVFFWVLFIIKSYIQLFEIWLFLFLGSGL